MSCSYRNRIDTVVAYVREELPPEEQEAFETHYFDCEECAREVLLMEKTTLAMQHHGHYLFAPAYNHQVGFLTRWTDRLALGGEKLSLHLGWTRVVINFAAMFTFAVAGYWLFQKIEGLLHSGEADSYIRTEGFFTRAGFDRNITKFAWPADFSPGSDPALRDRLHALRESYRNQEYLAVAQQLEKLSEEYPHDLQTGLLRGVCLFKAGKLEEAMQQLSAVTPQHGAPAGAYWFLALAYWQQQQHGPAGRVLRNLLLQPDTTYHAAARYLLRKMPH